MHLFGRSNLDTVREYVAAINARDFGTVERLLADDVRMTDSSGREMTGRANCLKVLKAVGAMAPDFRLRIDSVGRRGDRVYLTGGATASDPRLLGATHFLAKADHRVIHEWQAFSARPRQSMNYILSREIPPTGKAA